MADKEAKLAEIQKQIDKLIEAREKLKAEEAHAVSEEIERR